MSGPKRDRAALQTAAHWGLNEPQSKAFDDDGNTVVIACPGSGKTRLSIAKAGKYCARDGTSSVLMVTFSREAADEMRRRLAAAIGDQAAARVEIGTYHGLSHQILRQHYARKRKAYKVIKDGQAKAMILSARDRVAKNISNDEAIAGIARIKATYLDDDEVFAKGDPISQIFRTYQGLLRDFDGKDFSDLIRESTRLFRTGELKPFQIKNLLGDEFQDSDRMQYMWLMAHQSAGSTLHVVGDDDQSIYGFRNALGHIALTGLAEETGANVHFLTTNYRCGRDIVYVADQVVSENVGRIPKEFQVGSSLPGRVLVGSYHDAAAEAEAVILQFEELVDSPGFKPINNTYAALHRTNFGLDYLDIAGVGSRFKVVRVGGSSFVDRPHVSQALALLRLGLDVTDRLAWHESVRLSGMSPDGLSRFEEYIRKLPDHSSMLDAIYAKEWLEGLGKQDKTLFGQFRSVAVEWLEQVLTVREEVGSDERWNGPVVATCDRIGELTTNRNHKKDIGFLGKVVSSKVHGPLATRLARVAQKQTDDGEKEDADQPVLKLMTLHASKGLEFDATWIVGVSDGILPVDGSDLEEERRLFYVGITRAIAQLNISYLKSPDTQPSRFLEKLLKASVPAAGLI